VPGVTARRSRAFASCTDGRARRTHGRSFMGILWIILIVVVVLALLGFIGRGVW
jgi:flagellar basal body-associated protein FliL